MTAMTYTTASGDTETGTTFALSGAGAVASRGELHSWGWNVRTDGTATRDGRRYAVRAAFADANGRAAADVLYDLLALGDMDVANGTPGTLRVGEWELTCYVVGGTLVGGTSTAAAYDLELWAPDPTWRRTRVTHFEPGSGGVGETAAGLDFPHDMGFDYSGTTRAADTRVIVAGSGCSMGFVFYGPCRSPYARVTSTTARGSSTNVYGVDAEAEAGERIVIDPLGRGSIGGSVYRVGKYGERTNLYDRRRRGVRGSGSHVFEAMPAGELSVSWPQDFGIDVLAIEERGQLPWT